MAPKVVTLQLFSQQMFQAVLLMRVVTSKHLRLFSMFNWPLPAPVRAWHCNE